MNEGRGGGGGAREVCLTKERKSRRRSNAVLKSTLSIFSIGVINVIILYLGKPNPLWLLIVIKYTFPSF